MASDLSTPPSADFEWQKELPAKYVVSPSLLSEELLKLFGKGNFAVEMRHNAYKIKASKDFNVPNLVKRFQSLRRTPSTSSSFFGVATSVEAC